MALSPRFSIIDKAILTATGNSLVVCGSISEIDVNTSDMTKPDGTTTRDYTSAGSTANLNIIDKSTILYAELVWYSTVKSNVQGAIDLRSIQDSPITFKAPQGNYQITPQYTDSYTGSSGSIDRFRAADVTNIIKSSLGGNYTVSNVPISLPQSGLSNSRAGWTLVVIYRNDIFKPQKIVYTSGIAVARSATPLQSTISGFTTSSISDGLEGNIFMTCANGEPLNGVEYVAAGPSFANLTNIGNVVYTPNANPGTAPNNPGNSFFPGIINIVDPLNSNNGLLNINGTNGTKNNDGFIPLQTLGGRNKWDITSVDITNTLIPNQTLLAGQITESRTEDGIQLLAIGTQVNAMAPNIVVKLDAYDIDGDSEYNVEVGEEIVYTVQVKNSGDVSANNVILSTSLDSSLSFVPSSVRINNVLQNGADITKGINIGSVDGKGVSNISFTVRANKLPSGNLLNTVVDYSYQFTERTDIITNHAKTNSIQLIVQEGLLSITNTPSTTVASVGDVITYTVDILNTGSETTVNMILQDIVSSYLSFVTGSVIINGATQGDLDPSQGISLPDLAVGAGIKVTFKAKINSLPPSTIVRNKAYISFAYIFNQNQFLSEKTIASNTQSIQIQYIDIIGERCNNNNYPKVGDTVTYNLSLTNIGNIPATSVQVLEPLIVGGAFVLGSVKINGQIETNLNPFNGFILPDSIGANQTTKVEYKVLVNEINPSDLILNTAQVPFKYQISPGGITNSAEKDSNTVETITKFVCMSINETVDKEYALLGDDLYYTINIENNGNIDATNTIFLSNIQSDTTFVTDSVRINGVSYPGYNPQNGFNVGTICSKSVVEVSFKAKVINLPIPNIIYNQSSLVYSYLPDPSGNTLTNTIYTNTVQTIVNQALYSVTKTVDKAYAQLGDVLVYTTTIKNTGTVDLNNVSFVDYLGQYLLFYPGSVYVSGESHPNYDPSVGFTLGNIHPGDSVKVVLAATIVKRTPIEYIVNSSEASFEYKENPTSPIIKKTAYSNGAYTYVSTGILDITKTVDKSYGVIGDTLTYSFTVSNSGNVPISNPIFIDIIQSEASFINSSVMINGINKRTFNPNTGFSLGTINVGQVVTISFKVNVNTLPSPNVIKNSATVSFSYYSDPSAQPITKNTTSNTVTTVISRYLATLNKVVDKAYGAIGDVLNYTVTAVNTGTVNLSSVSFKDIIPTGATFVQGSVILDGVSKPDYNPNTGFIINDVNPGGNVVVMFKCEITSIPNPSQIKNTASINFKYKLNPSEEYINGTLTSNTVTTSISKIAVTNSKSVNKAYSTLGDTLAYTCIITNNGNIDLINTDFIDTVPNHTTFVPGSVKVGGVVYEDYSPDIGFTLGTITPGSYITVTFNVSVDALPSNGYITNSSTINYQYKINPNGSSISSSTTSNSVTTYINLGSLSVTKSADRGIVRLTDIITYNFSIVNTGNTTLKNLLFKDIVQVESLFNTGSLYVNGVNKSSFNPNSGFSLEDIPVGQQTKVSFTSVVNSLPVDNKLLNKADVTFSYYVDPNGSTTTKTTSSNTTTVYVYDTIVSANKSVDKAIAKIGDTINFNININNAGNVSAETVVFKDILDSNIGLVPDSVYINGVQKQGYNPSSGFVLDDIASGQNTEVRFSAKVNSRPTNNIIYNFANVEYKYSVDSEVINATIDTNTTQTFVAIGELTLTKSVNKGYATVGDDLSYSVIVKNTGSVNATGLSLKDLIPPSTSFNTGTVVVDGTVQSNLNPNTGFSLGDLEPNQYHTVVFSIHVDSLPVDGKVENTANTTFSYKVTDTDSPVTKTTTSNKVITLIKSGRLTVTKQVDKSYATIDDILSYTVTINNQGNANCFNVFFKDIIQLDAIFVSGSVQINGEIKADYNPNIGFNLSDIPGYESVAISFSAKVKSSPADNHIFNNAIADYSYYIDPANQPIVTEATSNTVDTMINIGSLTVTKAVSKVYATIGDRVSYTINIFNNGNVVAKNINFRDVIPFGLTFVPNSVKINGTSYSSYDPYSSFTLGNIISGDTTVISFDTTVTSVPNPSLISNTANITFAYRIDPNSSDKIIQVNSNTVTTQINLGSIALNKSVDKSYATRGDVLTYTVVLTNNGNVDGENIVFTDSLQSDIVFNSGSVKVNGTPKTDYDPNVGFNLGTIATLQSITVSFTATVIEQPTRSSVLNFALGTFSYKIDANGQYYSKSVQSNTANTIIIIPSLTSIKSVDKSYATLQNILNYSVLVKNTGNTTISSLFFIDDLSSGATFKPGTVVVDGVSYEGYDPIDGFNLPNLISGNTSLVEFKATVTGLPTPPKVTNYATSNGVYKINPQGIDYSISSTSNTVTTNINVGSLSNVKTVSKMYAKVNDTITFTSTISNIGNVTSTNVRFTDILQSDLSYISGTVRINNVVYPSLNPINGFALSDLAPNQVVTVAFDAKINSLPTPSYVTNSSQADFSYKIDPNGTLATNTQFSNNTRTDVVLGKLAVSKTVDKPIATIGDSLIYTVTLTNIGNVIDNNVLFQDTPSTGVVFRQGSVKVNGITQQTFDPTLGFSLGDIGIGSVVTIEFIADVVSVPVTNQVTNQAVITFKYLVDPKQQPYSDTAYSNTVTTNIALGSLNVTKEVNKKYATIGERLTYTVTITNTGNINATNVVFLDPTPHNSVYVLGSVTINGLAYTDYNPSAGFNLNTMAPGQIITVVYQVQVIDLC